MSLEITAEEDIKYGYKYFQSVSLNGLSYTRPIYRDVKCLNCAMPYIAHKRFRCQKASTFFKTDDLRVIAKILGVMDEEDKKMAEEKSGELQWWGYLHKDKSIVLKRYFDHKDIESANESDFVTVTYGPFEAKNRSHALSILRKRFPG
jgi:hypothetical protein